MGLLLLPAVGPGRGRTAGAVLALCLSATACSKPSAGEAFEAGAGGGTAPGAGTLPNRAPEGSALDRDDADAMAARAGLQAGIATTPVATLTLLDVGRMPRRKLRYAWRTEQKEQLTMDLRTVATTEDANAKAPGIALPPVRIVVAIDPVAVVPDSPDGDLHYAWRVTAADVTTDAKMPSQLAEGMRTEVAVVDHLAGTGVLSPDGLSKAVTIDPSSLGKVEATGQMVEQVRQTLRDMAAPFPDEPIGPGARWQKSSELNAKETRITQTETFTLLTVAGARGTLDDVLAQTAPPQPLLGLGAPAGPQARMESMLVSGDAKTSFDTGRIVADTDIDSTTTMVLSRATPGGDGRQMKMILRVHLVLAGNVR